MSRGFIVEKIINLDLKNLDYLGQRGLYPEYYTVPVLQRLTELLASRTVKDYGCIVRVTDGEAVKRLVQEVDSLFNTRELCSRPIGEWGRRL